LSSDRTPPNAAEHDRTPPNTAEHDRTPPNAAEQDRTRPNAQKADQLKSHSDRPITTVDPEVAGSSPVALAENRAEFTGSLLR